MPSSVDKVHQLLDIRPLDSIADYRACVRLQQETWGEGFSEQVPLAILKVSRILGGVATGAFDVQGRLVGFVFGMTGVRHGEMVHWSDMLAVRREWRDLGLGTILKREQRREVMALGVRTMHWTFDPLQSRNAHMNLVRLGAVMREYEIDMYGESGSPLHEGIGTDRFVVTWEMDSARVRDLIDRAIDRDETGYGWPLPDDAIVRQALSFVPGDMGLPEPYCPRPTRRLGQSPPRVEGNAEALPNNEDGPLPEFSPWGPADSLRIAIPSDIGTIMDIHPQLAVRWREATRDSITVALECGYEVTGFDRGDPVSEYILTRRVVPE